MGTKLNTLTEKTFISWKLHVNYKKKHLCEWMVTFEWIATDKHLCKKAPNTWKSKNLSIKFLLIKGTFNWSLWPLQHPLAQKNDMKILTKIQNLSGFLRDEKFLSQKISVCVVVTVALLLYCCAPKN